MTWFHKTQNASYNFKAPNIAADADTKTEVVFPTAEVQSLAYAATTAATVKRQITVLKLAEMAGAVTLNLTIGDDVKEGALLMVQAASDGTARALTFGTGMNAPACAGTISTKKAVCFIFDGTSFVATGAPVVIT